MPFVHAACHVHEGKIKCLLFDTVLYGDDGFTPLFQRATYESLPS